MTDSSTNDVETNAVAAQGTTTVADDGETASVTLDEQASEGEQIVVESATLPEGGFIAIHGPSVAEAPLASVLGTSVYLEPGTHEDITITLARPITESQTVVAMPHLDTNGNQVFDFVLSTGERDGPYTTDGEIVVDQANVTVEQQTTTTTTTDEGVETTEVVDETTTTEEVVEETTTVEEAPGEAQQFVFQIEQMNIDEWSFVVGDEQEPDRTETISDVTITDRRVNINLSELLRQSAVAQQQAGPMTTPSPEQVEEMIQENLSQDIQTVQYVIRDVTIENVTFVVTAPEDVELPQPPVTTTEEDVVEETTTTEADVLEETTTTEEDVVEETTTTEEDVFEETTTTTEVDVVEETTTTEEDVFEETTTTTEVDVVEETTTTEVDVVEETTTTTEVDVVEETTTTTEVDVVEDTTTTEEDVLEETTTTTEVDVVEETTTTEEDVIEETTTTEVDVVEETTTTEEDVVEETTTTTTEEQVGTDDLESFGVSNLDAPSSATTNDTVTVSATVSNPNDQQATQSVAFRLEGTVVARQQVTLDAGEQTTVSFEIDTSNVPPGQYIHGVYSQDFGELAVIVLEESGEATTTTEQATDGTDEETVTTTVAA